jgi:hypothetical protein
VSNWVASILHKGSDYPIPVYATGQLPNELALCHASENHAFKNLNGAEIRSDSSKMSVFRMNMSWTGCCYANENQNLVYDDT